MLSFVRHLLNYHKPEQLDKNTKPIQSTTVGSDKDNQSICGLEIQMNIDGTINIVCSWPEFDKNNQDVMQHLAKHYAMMIDAISSGLLTKDIINTLKNYQTENPMDTLFAQNVFYKIAEINYLKNYQDYNNEPLIKPSQVFYKVS